MAKTTIAELTKQFEALISAQAKFIEQSRELQNIDNAKKNDGKELKARAENIEKLKNNTTKLTEVDKEILRVNKEIERERIKIAKAEIKLQETRRKLITDSQLEAKTEEELIRKTKALTQLRKEQDRTTKAGREEIRRLTAEIKKNNDTLKQSDKQIGINNRNVGNYAKGFIQSFKSMALAYLGLQTAIRFIKNTISTIVDFQKAQSSLLAISGKTRKELEGLTKQAKQLGGTTEYTATQVTGLQIELAKLGFTTNEINLSTKAILNFASATGADLSAAAKTAGVALRAFGLDATKMESVVATLAVATTKSALTFTDYDTILSNAGPIAKAYGFSLEELIALSGKLADAGFDASKGSTALRNIMLNLADTNGSLAKALGRNVTNLDDLVAGMVELRQKGYNLNETLQLTDKRSVAAFNTFMQTAESAQELRDGISGVNDELRVMIDKKLDNLAGDITKLSSAWEGFILKGEGGVNAFRYIIQFLNDLVVKLSNLDLIFTRSSKLTIDQFTRSYDVLLAIGDKKAIEFQNLIKFADDIVFESLLTQGKAFEEQLKQAGFTSEEAIGLWNEYLKRREEQYLAEQKAAEDAAKAKIEAEAAAKAGKERLQEEETKNNQKELDKQVEYDEKAGETILSNILKRLNREKDAQNRTLENYKKYKEEQTQIADQEAEKQRLLNEQIRADEEAQMMNKVAAYNELTQNLGDIIGSFIGGAEISFKNFGKSLILMALDFVEKQVLLSQVEATARSLASAESVATWGAAGLAKAALIGGLIKAAFATAKAGISKFAKGVIGFQGEGTETSDSNIVKISNQESVITASGTKKHRNTLEAINKGLSSTEVMNAVLMDMNKPIGAPESKDDRILKEIMKGNKYSKKLIEIEENKPSYIPIKGGYKIILKNKEIIIRNG